MVAIHAVTASLASRFGASDPLTHPHRMHRTHQMERRREARRSLLRVGGRRAGDRRVTAPALGAAGIGVATAAVTAQMVAPHIARSGHYAPRVRTFPAGSLFDQRS